MGTQKKVENTPEWALGVRARCRLEPHLKEASWVGALSKAKHQKYFSTTPSRVLSRGLETEKPSIKHREGKEVSIVPSSPQTEGKWHCVSNGAFTTMASCGFHRGDEDKCTSVNLHVSTSLHSVFFLPINISVLPYRWGSGPQLLSGCRASIVPTLKPHRGTHYRFLGTP